MRHFDIIVIGGGHAGVEAAAVGARLGLRTALITFDRTQIGAMSCNPAIGGLGKGHLVREIDAFDGILARAADASAIHYRMLNRSKGSAVWGPRVQADRVLFRNSVQRQLNALAGLSIIAAEVTALRMEGGKVKGVVLEDARELASERTILCTGTFLGGVLYRGRHRSEGGRVNERAAHRLASQMRDAGLPIARLKTGTPPRLRGDTIDWARLERQPSEEAMWTMSSLSKGRCNPQLHCAVTRTNPRTHAIVADALDDSPLFSGAINAAGPRYCPSIEDKIHRFADREGHQIFLEPEGLNTGLIYPNGISTSLPEATQTAMVNSIAGLERAEIATPGYAVEYDHLDPRALGPDLQVTDLPGLHCAGQINGTTGYEEAAAQGLVAGLYAGCAVKGLAPPPLDRGNSYMAVMVDDLTVHGVSEPYRMLTARAEYRLRLRAFNSDTRLTPMAIEAGCVGSERRRWFEVRESSRNQHRAIMLAGDQRSLAKQVEGGKTDMQALADALGLPLEDPLLVELYEDARYAPYVERQNRELRSLRAATEQTLPATIDYGAIAGLSIEMRDRLQAARPTTLAQAEQVAGITPAALAALLVHARRETADAA